MRTSSRLAIALATGIFLAAWLTITYFQWAQTIQLTRCNALGKDLVCRLNVILFFLFYGLGVLTIPALALAFSAGSWRMLAAKGPAGGTRPAGVTLGVILLLMSIANRVLGYWVEAGMQSSGVIRKSWEPGLWNVLLAPLMIVAATLAMVWLWQVRERGRILALALLAVTLVMGAPTWILSAAASEYPVKSFLAAMGAATYLAHLAMFVYLLLPSTRALFRRANERK